MVATTTGTVGYDNQGGNILNKEMEKKSKINEAKMGVGEWED